MRLAWFAPGCWGGWLAAGGDWLPVWRWRAVAPRLDGGGGRVFMRGWGGFGVDALYSFLSGFVVLGGVWVR